MPDHALILNDLVKDFSGKRAVDGISIRLKKGEILGLLGPNGAGKTTTIRMIMNIIAPDSGTVQIFGKPFCEFHKNHIGYLPEERGLYRKLKVSETLDLFGKLKGMSTRRIAETGPALLKRFDLQDYAHKKVEELSKGMAQKLQFIITIMHSPDLLILDEPFAGLDPVNIELVREIILEKRKEGVSIIFSTHLMEYAEKIVDSVVMIHHGKKVLDGSLPAVKSSGGGHSIKVTYEGDARFVKTLDYIGRFKDFGKEMEIELRDVGYQDEFLKHLASRLSISRYEISEPSLTQIFMRKAKEDHGEK